MLVTQIHIYILIILYFPSGVRPDQGDGGEEEQATFLQPQLRSPAFREARPHHPGTVPH